MAIINATSVGDTRQDIVSSIVQEVIAEKAQLLPLVTDYSAQAAPGMKTLGIPRRSTFSVGDALATDATISGQNMTFSVDEITLSHYAARADIAEFAKIQSAVDVNAEVVKELGEAMARKVDDLILAQLKLGSDGQNNTPDHLVDFVDGTGDDIELLDILNARSALRSNGKVMFDDDQTYMLVSPEQERHLLKIDGLIHADKYGDASVIQRGELGRVYGFRCVTSDLLEEDEVIFFHKSACAFAAQQSFKLEFDRDLNKLNDVYVMSMIGGAKVLNSGLRNYFVKSVA